MMPRFAVAFVACCCALLAGCSEEFNPKGPYEERLVVLCFLTNRTDTVFARVYTTYNPAEFNPYDQTSDTPVKNATVTLSTDSSFEILRDTTLRRTDTGRFSDSVKAYYTSRFRTEFGKTCLLTASAPSYPNVSASVTVPNLAALSIFNSFYLDDPMENQMENVYLVTTLGSIAKGYLARAFLEYDVSISGVLYTRRLEVPIEYGSGTLLTGLSNPLYPVLRKKSTYGDEASGFNVTSFLGCAKLIRSMYTSGTVTIKRAVFVLTQVEPKLYNYYNIVNSFRDENSIRLDEPDYTNISGGLGVFGAFMEQEISLPLDDSKF